jgi:hypothetical protein
VSGSRIEEVPDVLVVNLKVGHGHLKIKKNYSETAALTLDEMTDSESVSQMNIF